MREGWVYKRLLDECSILYGYPFDSKCFSTSIEDMPLIRIRDVKEGKTTTFYKGEYPKEYVIHKGDYLIGMDGEFNISPWQSEDALLNQRVCMISCKTSSLLMRFVYRFLIKELKKIEDETPFVTVKHLSAKKLNQIEIPVPTLSEQQRIVNELDLLSSIIDKKKAQLKEYDQLAQSIFFDMFGDPVSNEKGWEVKKLGEVCSKISDGVHAKPNYTESGMPFISVVNINKSYLDFDNCKFVSFADGEIINKRTKPQRNDVLYTKVGATYGIPALVDTDKDFCLYVSVCLIKPLHDIIDSVFLKNMMALPYVKHQADKRIKGIGVPDLHLNQISAFNIILPPLSLQQSFASKIEAIERQKALVQQSITEAETLFNSRMDYYFN